ncbi:MAG: hypothetical protein KH921_20960 [Erysipelotrichaceae bacterium]|nr:hypothetical protein [Erysipelotrichaceae bacterium]
MQTSYEVVKNTLNFSGPDRLPMDFPIYGDSDFHWVGWNQIGTGGTGKGQTLDEWGCTWIRSEVENMGLVIGHPLDDWAKLDSYQWPDPEDPALYKGMERGFEGYEDKYIFTGLFALLFERMHHLHGFENTLADLYLEPEKMEILADRIVEFNIGIIENISSRFPGRIHGLNFTEDWGTELNTFISVPMFDEFFKPRYKKIFDACRKAGWDVWMHSCGKINNFIPSLIDVGVTSLNMFQPNTNGIEEIGREFAGKICFHTCCDIQTTLVKGTDEEIEQEAKKLLRCWGTTQGGFIATDYGDIAAIGSTLHKKRVMYEAFFKYDPFRKL